MTLTAIHPACSLGWAADNAFSRRDSRTANWWSIVSERTLLQRVADRDEMAVDETISRYSGLVWSLARRLSPTRADAEDAVQEIFVSLWKSAERFDPGTAKESTFVAMIARRRLIDRLRKSGRRPEVSEPEMELGDPTPAAVDGIATDENRMVSEAFDELSAEQQRVLRLSIQHGQSHSQISESTGIPLGTVKTHARRGMIRLRDLVNERLGSSRTEASA